MGEDQGLLIAPLVGQAGNPDQPCRFVLSEALQPLGDAQRLFVAVLPAAGQRQFLREGEKYLGGGARKIEI